MKFRHLAAAAALMLTGCDPERPEYAGTAECYQMGQLIWKGQIRQIGIYYFDDAGNWLHLPEGCVYRLRRVVSGRAP